MNHRYTYSVLRYQHSAFAGELLNAAVLLVCPDPLFVRLKACRSWTRFTQAYSSFDRAAVKRDFNTLSAACERIGKRLADPQLPMENRPSAAKLLTQLLGEPEGSLVWSHGGSGVTSDPAAELEMLFEEFVTRFDERPEHSRRDDDDVFQTLSELLQGTPVLKHMTEHVVRSDKGDVRFKRAFRNGVWHCVQPLSFDLTSDDQIQQKAQRWAGSLLAAQSSPEAFKPYFILGAPSSAANRRAFTSANALLRSAPGSPVVVQEENGSLVADRLIQAFH